MQIRDPKPEVMRLEELAVSVKSGDIKLPRFQRPFVWKVADMLKLLDSIYKGYPIGSILIWNSSQPLKSERLISGLEVNTEKSSFLPTNYLLDGQQRLTTLCGALFWNGGDQNSIWNIHFDLDTQEFVRPKESNLVNLFPLNKLILTSDFIQQCMKFQHHPKRDQYFAIAERLLKSIKDYRIAVVKIGDMTIAEVAPIFERINSTGRKLTIVDLMMAATWSDEFDLTAEINEIRGSCKAVGFDDISDSIILRSISASASLGINKDDIQKLRSKGPQELSLAAKAAKRSLAQAAEFLRNEIRIEDFSYVPYAFQFTYLAEYFRLVPNPTPQNIKSLVRWFWYTSVTKYFGTSNTGQISKDLAGIRAFAQGAKNQPIDYLEEIDISGMLFDRFNLRNASSTTFTVLLNSLNPTQAIDGTVIDGSHLKVKSNKFFASFCPTSNGVERLNISKVIYPSLLPPKWIEGLTPVEHLELHLLNKKCVIFAKAGQADNFVNERVALVVDVVSNLTGCHVKYKPWDASLGKDVSGDFEDLTVEEAEQL